MLQEFDPDVTTPITTGAARFRVITLCDFTGGCRETGIVALCSDILGDAAALWIFADLK